MQGPDEDNIICLQRSILIYTSISSACQGQQEHDQEFRLGSSHEQTSRGFLGSKIVHCVYMKNVFYNFAKNYVNRVS